MFSAVEVKVPENMKEETLTIASILLSNLSGIFAIHLTAIEIDYIKKMIEKNPEIFVQIKEHIDIVLNDGKLDATDIPYLVLIVSNIYHNHYCANVVKKVGVLNIIKYTIDSVLSSGLIPIPAVQLLLVKKLSDTAIELLKLTPGAIEKTNACCLSVVRRLPI
jgi:hypothetical protein